MKHFVLFFFFIEAISGAAVPSINLGKARDLTVDELSDEKPQPSQQIRKLPDVKIPKHIVIKSQNDEFNQAAGKKVVKNTPNPNQNSVINAKNNDDKQKQKIDNDVTVDTSSSSATTSGGSGTSGTEKFCEVYDRKIYDIVKMYRIQIQKMDNVSSTTTDPQKYFCRGFSNLMLMEENTGIPNSTYIANAKSDIKKAIEANKLVTGVFKIDVIEDRFLTAILDKYNQIATKGMDEEQKSLVANAIKQPQLLELKQKIDDGYGEADMHAGTVGTLKEKENADLTPHYTKNQLPLLNSITDTNGDVATQTQTLRNFRVTEGEMKSTETRIDEMLEVIQGLDVSEK